MSHKSMKKPLALAIGAAFAGTIAASSLVSAAENPFAMTKLNNGYEQVAQEGKCGEGKCGGKMGADAKKKEGKCGEGKCGADKKAADAKKAADTKKTDATKKKEGKCGEGKCGGTK